jgi:predicted transcriptional regulator
MGIANRKYTRPEPRYDYMKYWRVVRKYTMIKYELSEPDLEMIMFLYSEKLFNYYKFVEYANLYGWDRHRFKRLVDGGFIHLWREKRGGEHRLYELTTKGRRMITQMYKHLNYEEEISEIPGNNPVFKKTMYSHKVLAMGIQQFNEEVRKYKKKVVVNY